jgi:2-octaprenylphenol hydroxylase
VRALEGLSFALVAAAPEATPAAAAFDPRVYALSPGNVDFLRRLGVWEKLPAERITPVHAMRIHGDDGQAVLEFDAYQAGVAELAWIVEDALLQQTLRAGLDAVALRCERLEVRESAAELAFEDGSTMSARLVVGADGAQSFVRRAARIEAVQREYGQTALVANFRAPKPHFNVAYQWFQGGPILALLPLPADQVSMVWSLPAAQAERIGALSPRDLADELTAASHALLGALEPASQLRAFPLRRLSAQRLVAPRLALVGDAAHVIHPLAGQGLNLGLQDARVLAHSLNAREPGRDPGDYRLLRRYERQRAEPILAMDAVVSGLFALYGSRNGVIGRVRNAGLNLADRLPVLKNILMRQAMQ